MTRLDTTEPVLGDGVATATPVAVVDLELTDGLHDRDVRAMASPSPLAHPTYRSAFVLVLVHGEPIGTLDVPLGADNLLSEPVLRRAIADSCGDALTARGLTLDAAVALPEPRTPRPDPAMLAAAGVDITVVVCTRDHPDEVLKTLTSLQRQTYSPAAIVVVDNAPSTAETEQRVRAAAADDPRIVHLLERRPGLSWARNAGLAAVRSRYVAWIDDDEVADPDWTLRLAAAFVAHPTAVAASGAVIPAELETEAQVLYEGYGGHTKGRGFTPDVFDVADGLVQSPLYPLPPFGVGANMAFDVQALRAVGGFDTALGAGTLTHGGEDTLAFTQLLLAGRRVLYVPGAVVRHSHRRTYAGLRTQMIGYGVGLTAFYCALVAHDRSTLWKLLRLLPFALKDAFTASGSRLSTVSDRFPAELVRAKNLAMLTGPYAYVRARRRARRLARRPA